MFRKEDKFIFYVVTKDGRSMIHFRIIDCLYSIPSVISSKDSSICLQYDINSIIQFPLDDDDSNLVSGIVTKFLWSETFVCRLVNSEFVLYTELGDEVKTTRLYNNQFLLTRALQSFLNTFSRIVDIEYYDNEIWFLYDSYEIQRFSICTQKWTGSHSLQLYVLSMHIQ